MKRFTVPAWVPLIMMTSCSAVHAESLCQQCLDAAKQELKKCMEAAISAEDKVSCHVKHDAKAKSCEEGECKLEQAAKPGARDKSVSEPLPDGK